MLRINLQGVPSMLHATHLNPNNQQMFDQSRRGVTLNGGLYQTFFQDGNNSFNAENHNRAFACFFAAAHDPNESFLNRAEACLKLWQYCIPKQHGQLTMISINAMNPSTWYSWRMYFMEQHIMEQRRAVQPVLLFQQQQGGVMQHDQQPVQQNARVRRSYSR